MVPHICANAQKQARLPSPPRFQYCTRIATHRTRAKQIYCSWQGNPPARAESVARIYWAFGHGFLRHLEWSSCRVPGGHGGHSHIRRMTTDTNAQIAWLKEYPNNSPLPKQRCRSGDKGSYACWVHTQEKQLELRIATPLKGSPKRDPTRVGAKEIKDTSKNAHKRLNG